MKTATEIIEQNNFQYSYWGKKIIAAEKENSFSKMHKKEAVGWITCACGQLDVSVERDANNAPVDAVLQELGG